jgi:hypothetical protein
MMGVKMNVMLIAILVLFTAELAPAPAAAQQADLSAFGPGAVFPDFGMVAPIPDADFAIPAGMNLFVAFDTATPAEGGQLNRTLDSAARFVNMH